MFEATKAYHKIFRRQTLATIVGDAHSSAPPLRPGTLYGELSQEPTPWPLDFLVVDLDGFLLSSISIKHARDCQRLSETSELVSVRCDALRCIVL